jgi:hypothetical protein
MKATKKAKRQKDKKPTKDFLVFCLFNYVVKIEMV